jgi:TrmH family RNA methyltransferase
MISKNKIAHIRSLHQKKYRDKFSEFIVEGPKLIEELLNSNFEIQEIFTTISHYTQLEKNRGRDFELSLVNDAELGKISHLKTPNGMLALVRQPVHQLHQMQVLDGFSIILDGISDPGNMGTIIRTADWFGVHNIICSENCVELFNPKVVQATMGSVFRVKVVYTNLVDYLQRLENQTTVYGAFLDGVNIYNADFGQKGLLIIGSESHGISPEVEKLVNQRIHIPAMARGAESLNASVAAAICLSEFKRSALKNI